MSRLTTALIALLLVAVVVAGVLVIRGGSSSADEDAVEQVMADLESASREGDAARICREIFTPRLAALIARSSDGGSCAAEVRAQLFSPDAEITVESVEVSDESNASATVIEGNNGNQSEVFLVKQGGEWRIRSVTPA
jgi:hypothetical protein